MRTYPHGRGRGVTALGAAAVAGLLITGQPGSSLTATSDPVGRPNGTLVATTTRAEALPALPVLHRSERVILTTRGFADGATVAVQLDPMTPMQSVPASPAGTLRFVYQVPKNMVRGRHLLTFSGNGPTLGPASGQAGAALIITSIPNVGIFRFRVGAPAAN